MIYVILMGLAAAFGVSTVVLVIIVLEDYSKYAGRIVRKWRIAFSKRQTVNDALDRARRWERKAADDMARRVDAEDKAVAVEERADRRVSRMGSFIIAEQCGDHLKAIRANNYHAKEKKILRSIEVAAKNGYRLPAVEQEQLTRMLKQAHQDAIRAEEERERQAAIKAEIREEERVQREVQRTIREAEKEARIKQQAIEEAIRLLGDTHSEEIERLKQELVEAEEKAQRARSRAQDTRQGYIYVISNLGSFGKDVYKVGMTRRLEPLDRVRELGDASVPFTFDVHAMISSEDAPALEASLHRELETHRVNRVNLRKEFFKVELNEIISAVEKHHGTVEYVADAEALEYFESLAIVEEHGTVESRILEEVSEVEDD